MTKDAGTIGTKPAPGLHLLTILMLIIHFLPDNRKKPAKRKKESYDGILFLSCLVGGAKDMERQFGGGSNDKYSRE